MGRDGRDHVPSEAHPAVRHPEDEGRVELVVRLEESACAGEHGPRDPEEQGPDGGGPDEVRPDRAALHLEAGPGGDELAVYLRHLRNSDAMIGEVAEMLRSRGRDGVLCVFGDHVPSLPAVFASAHFDDPRTEYLVWRTRGGAAARGELRAEELAALVLRAAGLAA